MRRSWLHQALDAHFAREKARLQGARVGVLVCLHGTDADGQEYVRVEPISGAWRGWAHVHSGGEPLVGARVSAVDLLNYVAMNPAELRRLLRQFPGYTCRLVSCGPNWEEVLALAHFAEVE